MATNKSDEWGTYRDLMAGPEVMRVPPVDRWPAASGTVITDLTHGLPVHVQFKVLEHGLGLPLPTRGTDGAVGFDLRAACLGDAVLGDCNHWILPGEQHKIPTGLSFVIPPNHAGLVLSRSGLAAKYQVAVTNAPGLVDPDYRGEVFILLTNHSAASFCYKRGDRLAQLLVVPAPRVELQQVYTLDATERGEGGLGSTGVS